MNDSNSKAAKAVNQKMVTTKEATQLYGKLSNRHSWLTGGTHDEFLDQQYPQSMAEYLTESQEMVMRPFNKAATNQGLKESLEKLIQVVLRSSEKWHAGNSV